MKCGVKLSTPPELNICLDMWCKVCQFLLRDPVTDARYSNILPPKATLEMLGLGQTTDQKQEAERVPNDKHVEQWYDPAADPIASFDRMFQMALDPAA